jgi:hypothetical protein
VALETERERYERLRRQLEALWKTSAELRRTSAEATAELHARVEAIKAERQEKRSGDIADPS